MSRSPISSWRVLLSAIGFSLLAGCGSNPITNLFGGGETDDPDAPEEDDRISILALEQELTADPRYAGLTVEVPPSYVNASWTQPGGEADHTLHHLSAPLDLETLWKADVGDASARRARLTSPPIVVDGRVFVLDAAAQVTSFDAESGDIVWRTELTPEIDQRFRIRELFRGPNAAEIGFGGGVAFENGRIFVTSGFGFVAALDAQSGAELWRIETDAPARTPPTAYRGRVYLSTNTNEFIALEQETGEKAWTFQSFEESARFLSSSSPAAAGDLVVAPFSSGELVAFLTDNGRAVWDLTLA
ncbi:MAG: PQQ-binding-like beta-propeller repeat protein, partial [Pseudomonadota bacterium]